MSEQDNFSQKHCDELAYEVDNIIVTLKAHAPADKFFDGVS